MSAPEDQFALHIRAMDLPPPEREFVFAPPRKWRFDFAWPKSRIAVEIEGVTHGAGGRHQRVEGMAKDCEKYNEATFLGWRVYRFTQKQVKNGEAIKMLQRIHNACSLELPL